MRGKRETDAESGGYAFRKALPVFGVIAFGPFEKGGLAA